MISQGKRQHTPWQRNLAAAILVAVTLACNTTAPPSPTPRPTAPSQTLVPTWTPTPQPTTGEIDGQAIDSASSSPIPSANVYTDPPTISVTADEQGRYIIPEVPPGIYTITATKAGYTSASVNISVSAGKTTTADVHLMAASADIPSPTPRSSLADGLVAYYPFNGNADDESGNGNHGIVYGATLTTDRFGGEENAYRFDGIDDYIEIADSTSLDIEQQITIAAWVRFYSNPDGSSRIVDKSHTDCRAPWNMYGLRMCCKASQFAFDVTTHGSNHILNSGNDYPPDAWYFVVGTYDGSTQKLYVDGILDSSASVSGSIGTNNEPLLIGKHRGCKSQHFDGVLEDVRIYDRALSEAEIQTLYKEGEDISLVAYYPFNGNADDESGNGNHGIVYGATLAPDRFGNPDQAYEFDGTNDYIQVPTDILYHDEFAQSLWVWIPPSQPEVSQKHILQTGNGGIYYLPVEKNFRVDIYHFRDGGLKGHGSATRYYYDLSADGLEGTWNHIVLVGCSDNTAKFFVNGAQVSTGDRITDRGVSGDYNATVLGATINTRTDSIDGNFAGRIDDIRIYDRALSEAEVQALYREGGWSPGSALSWPGPSSNRATSDTYKPCLPPMLLPANRPTGNRTGSQSCV
jgi:hypothetical protein